MRNIINVHFFSSPRRHKVKRHIGLSLCLKGFLADAISNLCYIFLMAYFFEFEKTSGNTEPVTSSFFL